MHTKTFDDPVRDFLIWARNLAIVFFALCLVGCGQVPSEATGSASPKASASPQATDVSEVYQPTAEEIKTFEQALSLFRSRKPKEAIKLLEEMVVKNPESESAVLVIAGQILRRGGGQPAHQIATMLVEKFPESIESLRMKADSAYAMGQADESITIYGQLIEKDPEDSTFYLSRGVIYSKSKKMEQAQADLEKVIKLNNHSQAVAKAKELQKTWSEAPESDK